MIAFSLGVAGFQAGRPVIHPARAVRAVRGESACMMAGKVVVTDGTCSFYESRGIFQELHDHGDFSGIEAYSAGSGTTADAKKMLLSRNARYSGLLDILTFSEGEPAEAFSGADTWLSLNSDGATERRTFMERQLESSGVPFERWPALRARVVSGVAFSRPAPPHHPRGM